ncbi:MAG: hypothetical protein H0X30_26065 [Anaerolineae bacterium]|nr:hypothetical protein [Anaerolineae bacterium]
MKTPQELLERLNTIGASLQASENALALLGLGSVGTETARLDAYSDLDFFAIVQTGFKARYIDNLDWLSNVQPIAYAFRNTVDGYKMLFDDGIFCEFAVFEPQEMANIPFSAGRIVWKMTDFDESICNPRETPPASPQTAAFHLGEALTNLYVGMGRYRRGEKLSAARFIQSYAVDHVVQLAAQIESAQPALVDQYNLERRFEQRFPNMAAYLPIFVQGYDHSTESALAILTFLEANFEVNAAIAAQIRELCAET